MWLPSRSRLSGDIFSACSALQTTMMHRQVLLSACLIHTHHTLDYLEYLSPWTARSVAWAIELPPLAHDA